MKQLAEKREAKSVQIKDAAFRWDDPLDLEGELSEEERMVRDTARDYAQEKLFPRVLNAYRNEQFDPAIVREMGEMGFLGAPCPSNMAAAVSTNLLRPHRARDGARRYRLSLGDERAELAGDASRSSPTAARSSERKYLPKLASGEFVGCFGLTEPDFGSDPGGMTTRAVKDGGGYRLNGAKMWITNSPIADVAVVWAKLDDEIRGFIVERGMKGFSTPKIEGKFSLRAIVTGEIVLRGLRGAGSELLPNVSGLSGPFGCLNRARYRHCVGRDGGGGVLLACGAASTRWIANSSAARSPPTSSSRKSSPTCRRRSRLACTPRCASAG